MTQRTFSGHQSLLRLLATVGMLLLVSSGLTAQEVGGGHYLPGQAERGAAVYRQECASCHGTRLEGGVAPVLVGPEFGASWSGPERTVDDLFFIMRTTMPRVGGLLEMDQYVDLLAFILEQNGLAAGGTELTAGADLLATISLVGGGRGNPESPPAFIEGERGLEPRASGPTQAQLDAAPHEFTNWLTHTHDYTGRRYSGLAEINRENAKRLQPVCAYQTGYVGTFQTGPIVYEGTMFITTVPRTVALNAETCRPIWMHEWEPLDQEGWVRNRGVAIKDGRVVRGTDDGYLMALDMADGTLLWARKIADPGVGETFTMAPLIWNDLVFIGPAGSENNISGWVGAFRLRDGEPVWRFETVPGARDPSAGDTWPNPESIPLGGGAVWTPFTLDTERGELYVAVTNPAPDLPAHMRPGPNLYSNSIVALDARTGALRWYEQLVPNDAHDWDLTQVSPIFSTTVAGRRRDVVSTVGKDGILRLLDRERHERLWETPITTLENVEVPLTRDGVHVCPGVLGGVEWNGPAYNPTTDQLYSNAVDWCTTFSLADTVRHVPGALYLGGDVDFDDDWQGWITAVDAGSGQVAWRYRSEAPIVAAVTTTAGGLVMTGELNGDFLVLDAESGEVLYRFNTGAAIGGGITTYEAGGKQYVAVMSGSPSAFWVDEHPGAGTVFVFGLAAD